MYSSIIKYLTILIAVFSLISCGGGGGDDSESESESSTEFTEDENIVITVEAIVEDFQIVDRSTTSIMLTWGFGGDFDSYNIFRDGALIANVDWFDDSFIDTDLDVNTMYSYQISGLIDFGGGTGESELSAVVIGGTLSIATGVPAAPISLIADDRRASSIGIEWTDNSNNEEGYKIYRDGVLVETVVFGEQSHTSSGLTFDTDYDFTVTAYNDAGESLPIDATYATRHETVKPIAPTGVSAVNATTNSITLGFTDNANNEDGYFIYLNGSDDPNQRCDGIDLSQCQITGLVSATTYTLRLVAFTITSESTFITFFLGSDEVEVMVDTL